MNESLPICFNLREQIPTLMSAEHAIAAARTSPHLTLIEIDKDGRDSPVPPPPFKLVETITRKEQTLRFYRAVSP